MPISNRKLFSLLSTIKFLAESPYPLPENIHLDDKLIFALGEIVGIASKAMDEYDLKVRAD